MAVYWCLELVPLAVTALIPLTLAPLMGILEADVVCKNYFKVRQLFRMQYFFSKFCQTYCIQCKGTGSIITEKQ